MSAAERARSLDIETQAEAVTDSQAAKAASTAHVGKTHVPTLRVVPFETGPQPRRFQRVPTHAVGVHPEQREYPRAALKLPLCLRGVDGILEPYPVTLVTRDLSSTGVYFLCPRELKVGAIVELEIVLVRKPLGRGNVVLGTIARVKRVEPAAMPRWFGIAASFDDVQFDRDDVIPSRFLAK